MSTDRAKRKSGRKPGTASGVPDGKSTEWAAKHGTGKIRSCSQTAEPIGAKVFSRFPDNSQPESRKTDGRAVSVKSMGFSA